MKKNISILPNFIGATACLLVLLAASGCRSASEQRDLMTEDAIAGERPVAMRGEGTFLDGKLTAAATVSRGFGLGIKDAGKGKRFGKEISLADSYPTGFGGSEDDQKEAVEEYYRIARGQRAAGSPMPPVTLRVQFQNQGPATLELEITEVNSDLGNFAVRPPKLVIAPGESGALEPMISQLGVTSDEIPIKVVVRMGGKAETQVIAVKNLLLPAAKK
ncbi:MAG: hypothetical protein EXS32_08485 [Opitutus sp.]|nr:hypothetical protein [Opitutus sp.]